MTRMRLFLSVSSAKSAVYSFFVPLEEKEVDLSENRWIRETICVTLKLQRFTWGALQSKNREDTLKRELRKPGSFCQKREPHLFCCASVFAVGDRPSVQNG